MDKSPANQSRNSNKKKNMIINLDLFEKQQSAMKSKLTNKNRNSAGQNIIDLSGAGEQPEHKKGVQLKPDLQSELANKSITNLKDLKSSIQINQPFLISANTKTF